MVFALCARIVWIVELQLIQKFPRLYLLSSCDLHCEKNPEDSRQSRHISDPCTTYNPLNLTNDCVYLNVVNDLRSLASMRLTIRWGRIQAKKHRPWSSRV
jgi:hypothetical protein